MIRHLIYYHFHSYFTLSDETIPAAMDLEIYEHKESELKEVLTLRNGIFGHIGLDHWHSMECTAIVARTSGKLVGFIPLQYREQLLTDTLAIPVAYENAVGVAEGMRGQGIGTRMIDAGARFMTDRIDALFVIRGDEGSPGYRFYRKSGHGDVAYARTYAKEHSSDQGRRKTSVVNSECGQRIINKDDWLDREPELLQLYHNTYGRFGGGRKREPGYWRTIFNGHVFKERNWQLIVSSRSGRLAGYSVCTDGAAKPTLDTYVYEVVGEDDKAVEELLDYAFRLSDDGGVIFPYVSLANPVLPKLERMGFADQQKSRSIMVRILRPDRIFRRLAKSTGLLEKLNLTVSTPHRNLEINNTDNPAFNVHIETKESLLSRLFCRRLNLEEALAMELVRWDCRDTGLKKDLCSLFFHHEWVQWFTDYV